MATLLPAISLQQSPPPQRSLRRGRSNLAVPSSCSNLAVPCSRRITPRSRSSPPAQSVLTFPPPLSLGRPATPESLTSGTASPEPPLTGRPCLSDQSTYASVAIWEKVEPIASMPYHTYTSALQTLIERDEEAELSCITVSSLLNFVRKFLSESVTSQVKNVLNRLDVDAMPLTTLSLATAHIIDKYCVEPTDAKEKGFTGGSGASFVSLNPSSGSGGSKGNDKASTGGGGGKEKSDDDGEGNRTEGEATNNSAPQNLYRRTVVEIIRTTYSSPKSKNTSERVIKRAALTFSGSWSAPYPSFTISPTTQPKVLLFHATRASQLRKFAFGGIGLFPRKNELHVVAAFYTSNSMAHAVMHCLTYHHSPSPEQVDPITVIVFAVDPKFILGKVEGMKAHVFEVPEEGGIGYRDKYLDFSVFVNRNWEKDPIAYEEQVETMADFIVAPICLFPSIQRDVGLAPALELDGSRPLQVAAATRKATTYLDGCVVKILQEERQPFEPMQMGT